MTATRPCTQAEGNFHWRRETPGLSPTWGALVAERRVLHLFMDTVVQPNMLTTNLILAKHLGQSQAPNKTKLPLQWHGILLRETSYTKMTIDIDPTLKGVLPVRWTQELFLYPQSKVWTPNNMTHILLEPWPDGKKPQLCLQNPAVPPFAVMGLQCAAARCPGAAQLAGSSCSCPLLKKMDCRLTPYACHPTTTQATGPPPPPSLERLASSLGSRNAPNPDCRC